MQSREVLSQYIDMVLKRDKATDFIVEMLDDLEQIPVQVETDTDGNLLTENIPNYIEDKEVFTENANYKIDRAGFHIFDCNGKMILDVAPDASMKGNINGVTFTVPLSHPEDKIAFLDFCDILQRNNSIKYPEGEE